MTEEADAAMDALKTNRILEENIFILTMDNLSEVAGDKMVFLKF